MKYVVIGLGVIVFIGLICIFYTVIIYNLTLFAYSILLRVAALFNKKAKAWVQGRRNLYKNLSANFNYPDHKKIWVHCASLGEFEQGRTLIDQLRMEYPDAKILLTFFSPSGYEVRKNYPQADYVTYLPLDTASNAKKFISIVRPDLVVFIKYEFWHHFLYRLHKENIPVFLVSAVFRSRQLFFKWFGGFFRRILSFYTKIFIQNEASGELLAKKKITNYELAYDLRIDRVIKVAEENVMPPFFEEFTKGYNVLVAGSTWTGDERVIKQAFYHSMVYENFKLILVPHNVDEKHLKKTRKKFKLFSVSYSALTAPLAEDILNKRVLIVDTMGMLASLYKLADICFIGGGYGAGIHNILEAAVYGKIMYFGPKYKKFPEAVDLVETGSAFKINDSNDMLMKTNFLNEFKYTQEAADENAKKYVLDHRAGTEKVMETMRNYL